MPVKDIITTNPVIKKTHLKLHSGSTFHFKPQLLINLQLVTSGIFLGNKHFINFSNLKHKIKMRQPCQENMLPERIR